MLAVAVIGDKFDLDVEGQSADGADEAVVLCNEGADVRHDVAPSGFSRSHPSHPCCDPTGRGQAGRTASSRNIVKD